jgi:hypothetical protein
MTSPGAAVIIWLAMKKLLAAPRKHGRKTQLQALPSSRLTTQVTFESSSQSYFWMTDRGRSKLIKH